MTIAEKNVWLAKHQIEAVFANEIPLLENNKTFDYVNDYSQLENFINTYQDYANTIYRSKIHNWFNAELLTVADFETVDKEKIENWMKEDKIPPFEKWLSESNGSVLLNTYTNMQNNLCGIEEAVWIASGAVKKADFPKFLVAMETYFEDRNEMLNVCDFHAYQECQCYCTPQEACLVHSEREINNHLLLPDSTGDIVALKLAEECLCEDELETERYFILPSKITRKLTGIVYGDGYLYSDIDGNTIAKYSNDGENWGTYQKTLMINKDVLCRGLDAEELKQFWLFRIYREPTSKARERYETIMHDSDRTYLVWDENDQFNYKLLLPIELGRGSQNTEIAYDIKTILKQYGISDEDELFDKEE